jgi:hypothetical protein
VTFPLYCALLTLRNGVSGHTKRPRIRGFAAYRRAGCVVLPGRGQLQVQEARIDSEISTASVSATSVPNENVTM